MGRHLALLFAPLLLLVGLAAGELVLVYSIHRHGARNVLPKTSTLKESNIYGGPTLLPAGKKQCYEAGKAFRSRYLDLATCNDTCLTPPGGGASYGLVNSSPTVSYSNYNLLANSSGLHRTVLSATSFFLGAFGGTDNPTGPSAEPPYLAWPMVPVFSVPDDQDVAIRGYTKCPTYDRALEKWFAGSDEFKRKEAETAEARASLARLAPGLNTSLANAWNMFDALNVWRTYGVGDPMPAIPQALYDSIVEMATWLETAKMRSALAGNRLGGVLLADVLNRVDAAVRSARDGFTFAATYYRWLSVTGHYNTQLGLLAALQADTAPGSGGETVPWFGRKIPSPAAVLAFELHTALPGQPKDAFFVRAVMQDGPDRAYQVVPLPCSVDGVGGFCPLQEFVALAAPQAMGPRQWCSACGNRDAMVCRAV